MSTATNGRRREHNIRHHLEADGYRIIRSAGSKGPIDLIAAKPGERLAIQVKPNTKPIAPLKRAQLLEWALWFNATPLVASKGPRGTGYLYRQLTGPGPHDWMNWTPDWAVTP